MRLYVVTEGEYSDYHIVGIYSTREQAERIKKYYSGLYQHPDIEEWELDQNVPNDIDSVRDYYRVTYNDDDQYEPGSWSCKRFTKTGKANTHDCPFEFHRSFPLWFRLDIPCDRVDDEEHAIKIAQDKMIEIIAMEAGI